MKKIIISALWFPITACAEYVARAFKRRTDCEILTVGPAFGNKIPWGTFGMVLPDKYIFNPDIALPGQFQIGTDAPIEYVEGLLPPDFIPDLWLDIDAGFHLSGRPKKGIKSRILTDPHVLRGWYDGVTQNYDFTFCTQTPYAGDFEYYLPYGFDVEWHSPMDVDGYKYDGILLGNTYPQRNELVQDLRALGYNIKYELGIGKDDARIEHALSKIGLNWSSMQDLTARVWEVMGCGIIPIVNRVPDLTNFFNEGVHYLGFDDKFQAISQFQNVMNNFEEYKQLGINARKCVIENHHSWDDRVNTVLEVTGLIDK